MSEDWPHVRFIKRNKLVLKLHDDAMERCRESFLTHHYAWKKTVCEEIGAPGYYCREPGKGHLNWKYIKDGLDEMLNGPKPTGNGDVETLDRYRRNKIALIPVTTHFFEDTEAVADLAEIDPTQRRLWFPLKSGHPADGWISNREPRFGLLIDEHFRHRAEWDDARRRVFTGSVAGSYDAKVIIRDDAQNLIGQAMRPKRPVTLEDLTGI